MSRESYQKLIVWQRAMELVRAVYALVKQLPREERYNLTSQICRAAVSVPSNIAEGYKRRNTREYIQFLSIANASAAEVEAQLLIIDQIYLFDCSIALSLVGEAQKMLNKMIKTLVQKNSLISNP